MYACTQPESNDDQWCCCPNKEPLIAVSLFGTLCLHQYKNNIRMACDQMCVKRFLANSRMHGRVGGWGGWGGWGGCGLGPWDGSPAEDSLIFMICVCIYTYCMLVIHTTGVFIYICI